MTEAEAGAEAKRRWGEDGAVGVRRGLKDGRVQTLGVWVGYFTTTVPLECCPGKTARGGLKVVGRGETFEEAFGDAGRNP